MRHFLILAFLFIFTTTPSSSSIINVTDLNKDPFMLILRYSQPMDIYNLTETCKKLHGLKDKIITEALPYHYQALGEDMRDSLMKFDHPRWNLKEKLPKHMKMLIHIWYLHAMQLQDEEKKFAFLMAAGRAGHFFAALRVGRLLMNSPPEEPPLDQARDGNQGLASYVTTMEDLIAVVPQMSYKKVQNWSITCLEEKLTEDANVDRIDSIHTDESYKIFERFNQIDERNLKRETIIKLTKELSVCYRKLVQKILTDTAFTQEKSPELAAFEDFLNFQAQTAKTHTTMIVVSHIFKVTFFNKKFDFNDANIKLVLKLIKAIFSYCSEPIYLTPEDLIAQNEKNLESAHFLEQLAYLYRLRSHYEREREVNKKLSNLRLIGSLECNLAKNLLMAYHTGEDTSFHSALETAIQYQHHCTVGALLGDELACTMLSENYLLTKLNKENANETFEAYNDFYPLQAFALQLNYMMRPTDISLIKSMADFYNTPTRQNEFLEFVEINKQRSQAYTNLASELEERQQREE